MRNCIFELCGLRDVTRKTFAIVVTSREEQCRAWMREAAETVARIFPAAEPQGCRAASGQRASAGD